MQIAGATMGVLGENLQCRRKDLFQTNPLPEVHRYSGALQPQAQPLGPVLTRAVGCFVGVYENSEDNGLKQDFILARIFLAQVVNK